MALVKGVFNEKTFESINLPFVKYLEYEDLLNQKQFIDHKSRIIQNQEVVLNNKGENVVCPICFKQLKISDSLCQCPNSHKMHQS